MKGKLFCLITAALLIGAIAGVGALVETKYGEDLRNAVYGGGAAGLVIGAAGLPFLVKLKSIIGSADAAIWTWWGLAVLTRLVLVVISAVILIRSLPERAEMCGLLALMSVTLITLFVEVGWLAVQAWKPENGSAKN